jgi:hypothetical protein
LSAKVYKILGDRYLDEYEYSIWADARILLKFSDAQELVDKYLAENDIALFKHPDERDCIYDEYEFLIKNNHLYNFDDPLKMEKQINRYKSENFPKHFGLIAGGFIVRKIHSPSVKKIQNNWWHEVINNSRRDQLSFNYVIWKLKERYTVIPGNGWDNTYIRVIARASEYSQDLDEFEKVLHEKERTIAALTNLVEEKDRSVAAQTKLIDERDNYIKELEEKLKIELPPNP